MIEGGVLPVRTTSHARVGGRAEVSVGGRVEVRRALGRVRLTPKRPALCSACACVGCVVGVC